MKGDKLASGSGRGWRAPLQIELARNAHVIGLTLSRLYLLRSFGSFVTHGAFCSNSVGYFAPWS